MLGHSWGTLVALNMVIRKSADARGPVLISGYYYPTGRKGGCQVLERTLSCFLSLGREKLRRAWLVCRDDWFPRKAYRRVVSVCGLRVPTAGERQDLQTRDVSNIHLIYLQHSQATTMLNRRKARLPGGCHVRYL
ncbi:hypothetical protein [Paraburkholderia kirstenboschensis]|uniref:hypothetical protein n=1 Tax=Paraburkholderia kirstenboschensis TaxID=1245436 RepID=UPI0037423539